MSTATKTHRRGFFQGEDPLLIGDTMLSQLPQGPPRGAMYGEASAIPVGEAGSSARALRTAFAQFPSGVVAVCGTVGNGPVGMVMSSFTSVSLDPPLVSVCVDHGSTTWPVLRTSPRLGITVLAAGHEEACRQLATKGQSRFTGLDTVVSDAGAVFLPGGSLWLECRLHEEIRAGDHDLVLLEARLVEPHPEIEPLVFHGSRYRRLQVTEEQH